MIYEGDPWHFLCYMLRYWISDGYYNAGTLEATLKRYFGLRQRMFEYLPAKIATKTAVTATTISDASPVILSNYNVVGVRQSDCGELAYNDNLALVLTQCRLPASSFRRTVSGFWGTLSTHSLCGAIVYLDHGPTEVSSFAFVMAGFRRRKVSILVFCVCVAIRDEEGRETIHGVLVVL